MALTCTLLVGNPKPHSRTLTVACRVGELLVAALDGRGIQIEPIVLIDLAGLAPRLLTASGRDPLARSALDTVRDADLLLVVSPTFKATYSGLLKVFFDLLPPRALCDAVAVPVMTAASRGHQHAVETHLRPLLYELGARLPVGGLCVLESDFPHVRQVVESWVDNVVPVLAAVLDQVGPRRVVPAESVPS